MQALLPRCVHCPNYKSPLMPDRCCSRTVRRPRSWLAPRHAWPTTWATSHSVRVDAESSMLFVTYPTVIFARHTTEKNQTKSIDLIHSFRNYLHYHIKCAKGYLHSRMRAKTTQFLQVLNRARPESDVKEKKTIRSLGALVVLCPSLASPHHTPSHCSGKSFTQKTAPPVPAPKTFPKPGAATSS